MVKKSVKLCQLKMIFNIMKKKQVNVKLVMNNSKAKDIYTKTANKLEVEIYGIRSLIEPTWSYLNVMLKCGVNENLFKNMSKLTTF